MKKVINDTCENRKFKVRFYYDNKPSLGERVSSKTKTVPDLSYSIQEIIDRFSRNNLVDMEYHEPVFSHSEDFDNDDLEKIRDFDLTDKWTKYEQLKELRKQAIDLTRQKQSETQVDTQQAELINEAKQQSKEPEKID